MFKEALLGQILGLTFKIIKLLDKGGELKRYIIRVAKHIGVKFNAVEV